MWSAARSGLIAFGGVGLITAAAAGVQAQESQPGDDQAPCASAEHQAGEGPRQPRAGKLVEEVAEILGVPRSRVVRALARGVTLAQVAEESDSSGEELSAALLARLTERVERAVANGRIDEARAAEILAAAPERIERLVSTPHLRPALRFRVLQRAADVMGVTPDRLHEELAAGASLAQVAAENGVSELVDGLIRPIAERLERWVASGRIDQEQADERLAYLIQRIAERVGRPFTEG